MNDQVLLDLGEMRGKQELILQSLTRLEVRIETKLSDLETRLRPLETIRVRAGVIYTLVASVAALAASHIPDILSHLKVFSQ